MNKITQKIQFQDLTEDHTWEGEVVQLNGQEVIFENVDDEGFNFLLWSPLFGSNDKHDINNYLPFVVAFDEISDYTLYSVFIDNES